MKFPKWIARTTQEQIDVGLNGFAVTLLAESFAHERERFGEDSILLVGYAKDGLPVYITVASVPPTELTVGLRPAFEYVRGVGQALSCEVADALSLKVPNASNKLRELWRRGYLGRRELCAPTGGKEHAYFWPPEPIGPGEHP